MSQWNGCLKWTSPCLGILSIQSAESTLFIGRECLASVGSFVLLLICCLAHITAEDLHQNSNPPSWGRFIRYLQHTQGCLLLFLCDADSVSRDHKWYKLCNISNWLKISCGNVQQSTCTLCKNSGEKSSYENCFLWLSLSTDKPHHNCKWQWEPKVRTNKYDTFQTPFFFQILF